MKSENGRNEERVEVFSGYDRQELMLARMALDREEIPYEVTGENFSTLFPSAGKFASVHIFVDRGDAERARAAIGSPED